jgi:hypothetical protein
MRAFSEFSLGQIGGVSALMTPEDRDQFIRMVAAASSDRPCEAEVQAAIITVLGTHFGAQMPIKQKVFHENQTTRRTH